MKREHGNGELCEEFQTTIVDRNAVHVKVEGKFESENVHHALHARASRVEGLAAQFGRFAQFGDFP